MGETAQSISIVRFGAFEVDLRRAELRKSGLKVKLTGQPFEVLAILLERPGEVVSRQELCRRLWTDDTFVDFEHGLNAVVKRLREALDESPGNPRFIETVPRQGYRFIGPITGQNNGNPAATAALPNQFYGSNADGSPAQASPVHRSRHLWIAGLVAIACYVRCCCLR
jgi:DNA-binding winged helix-turn-helix (wHTH) protein